MANLKVNTVSGIGTEGPVLNGGLHFRSKNYLTLPKGTTTERTATSSGISTEIGSIRYNTDSNKMECYVNNKWMIVSTSSPNLSQSGESAVGARAIIHMGYGPANKNTINAMNMAVGGTAIDFGNSTISARQQTSCSSRTRALRGGGYSGSGSPGYEDVIDFVTISSTGDATDFGDLTQERGGSPGALASATRGVFAGGYRGGPSVKFDIIDFVTIASTGDAKDFGDLVAEVGGVGTGAASPIRGVFFGGYNPSGSFNTIQFITIATTGNTKDFGDCVTTVRTGTGASNATRGLYMGGQRPSLSSSNTIEFITIASTGNSMNFGDLDSASDMGASAASPTKAIHQRAVGTTSNVCAVMISTQGDAIDFGDLTETAAQTSGCSNAHGGL